LIGKLIKTIFRGKPADERDEHVRDGVAAVRPAESARTLSAEPRRQWISNPWHAVGIIPCLEACSAAQAVRSVRFLSQEAPVLPLKGCTTAKCACRYRHFQDRRGSPRRDADIIGPRMGWPGRERRVAHGRRSTDGL
jgi:hypothetical protein